MGPLVSVLKTALVLRHGHGGPFLVTALEGVLIPSLCNVESTTETEERVAITMVIRLHLCHPLLWLLSFGVP